MRCARAEMLISLRIDRQRFPELEDREFEEHLSSCASCRRVMAMEEGRAALLDRSMMDPGGDQELVASRILEAARLSAALQDAERRHSRIPALNLLLAPLAFSAAMGLALAAGGLWWWMGSPGAEPGAGGEFKLLVEHESRVPAGFLPGPLPEGTGQGILRSRRTIHDSLYDFPAGPFPAGPGKKLPPRREAGEMILELERTDSFRFAGYEYR